MTANVRTWPHTFGIAIIVTIATLSAGYLLEWHYYGLTQNATFDRVKDQTEDQFEALTRFLATTSHRLATDPTIASQLATESNRESRTQLFKLARTSIANNYPHISTTIYDGTATARAWTGRPTELPLTRILGDASTFIVENPLGLRLVVLHPIETLQPDTSNSDSIARRVGSVATEYVLTNETDISETNETALFADTLVKLTFRTTEPIPTAGDTRAFLLETSRGEPLLSVTTTEANLALGRTLWRQTVNRIALALFASILIIFTAPTVLRHPTRLGEQLRGGSSLHSVIGLIVAIGLLWLSSSPTTAATGLLSSNDFSSNLSPYLLRTPGDILLLSLMLIVIGSLLGRLSGSPQRFWRHNQTQPSQSGAVAAHISAGVAAVVVILAYEQLLNDIVGNSYLDLVYPSLNPWDTSRISLLVGLLLLAAASQWIAASTLALTASRWHIARRAQLSMVACWMIPVFAHLLYLRFDNFSFIVMSLGPIILALTQPFIRAHYRTASQSARFVILFGLLVVPAVIAYPRMVQIGADAKSRFIEDRFSPSTAAHPQRLLESLSVTQDEIDGVIELLPWPDSTASTAADAPDPNLAFRLWQRTELARLRLTSAIEFYGPEHELISRFALNLPEDTTLTQSFNQTNCEWEVYGEVSPFGSQERRLLHAQRGICLDDGQRRQSGTIVVHVPLDYSSLPFGTAPIPYYGAFQPDRAFSEPGRIGANVQVAVYGWGLTPLFTTGPDVWSIDETLFEKIYRTQTSFWTTLTANGVHSQVYFSNNRYGIYALGFPILTFYDHLVRTAEIVALLGIVYLLWVLVLAAAGPLVFGRSLLGHNLLHEFRTSFYRRLFLAFVIGAVIPMLVLAIVVRNYSINQLQRDAETFAARTVVIAQRVVAELRETAEPNPPEITDDLLVFVGQVINQDVNIFEGSRLLATSERDLFASGLLPTRTPEEVYESIALSQSPNFVTTGSVGRGDYLVAAAPLFPGARDLILTVPMASRQYEIDQQIDELDRGLLLAVMLLILLGATSSYYIAERIADPVRQLTTATKRIAQGTYDEPIVTRTTDEFEQLVYAFNQMANELVRQRRELAHTNRLKAWAEMARQVAHEIKNPLTPVQLSAEHLLRVHKDRGSPLGSVLDDCVTSILKQVRILRQISSDFSSYGTSPEIHKRPTTLDELVLSVIDPYRHGLLDRIKIRTDLLASSIQLFIDPVLVGRAFTNIIENALHAMPNTGSLIIEARPKKNLMQITIHDTGVGFDADTRRRIFEPYFSTKVRGTGLGMAIAKRNIELNGGSIAVESIPSVGTTVTVSFPSDP